MMLHLDTWMQHQNMCQFPILFCMRDSVRNGRTSLAGKHIQMQRKSAMLLQSVVMSFSFLHHPWIVIEQKIQLKIHSKKSSYLSIFIHFLHCHYVRCPVLSILRLPTFGEALRLRLAPWNLELAVCWCDGLPYLYIGNGWKSPFPSIKKWLFRVPGCSRYISSLEVENSKFAPENKPCL